MLKKVTIVLTVVVLTTFSSYLLANDFAFPGISVKEQVRLNLWVRGVQLQSNGQNTGPQFEIELEKPLIELENGNELTI